MKKKRPRKAAKAAKTAPRSRKKAAIAKPRTAAKKNLKKTAAKASPRRIKTKISNRKSELLQTFNLSQVEPLSHAVPLPSRETITDLPFSYNQTKLVLMVRDPYWAFTYWDFSTETWNWIQRFKQSDPGLRTKLRIHNLDRGEFEDKDVSVEAKNWYLEVGLPETTFEVELGFLDSHGKFHRIALSNRVRTPRSGPSRNIDSAWELSEAELAELYRLSGGGKTGPSSGLFSSFKRRSS